MWSYFREVVQSFVLFELSQLHVSVAAVVEADGKVHRWLHLRVEQIRMLIQGGQLAGKVPLLAA